MFGIPLAGSNKHLGAVPMMVYRDNESVVTTNTSNALSKLNKKHNSIAFHSVCKACAGNCILVAKCTQSTIIH